MPINDRESRTSAIRQLAKLTESLCHHVSEVFDETEAAKQLACAADLLGLGPRVSAYLNDSGPTIAPSKKRKR